MSHTMCGVTIQILSGCAVPTVRFPFCFVFSPCLARPCTRRLRAACPLKGWVVVADYSSLPLLVFVVPVLSPLGTLLVPLLGAEFPEADDLRSSLKLTSENYGVCVEFGWVGFLLVCFLYTVPTHERKSAVEKKCPHCRF